MQRRKPSVYCILQYLAGRGWCCNLSRKSLLEYGLWFAVTVSPQSGTRIALFGDMKLAVPIWQERISPVFDVAQQIVVIDLLDRREIGREDRTLTALSAEERALELKELGVEMLLCAGVSQGLEALLVSSGIRVVARICGSVEDVLAAFLTGRLGDERFAMPGCCRRKQQRHRGECRRGRPI